jgi:hypothetical protein
MVDRDESYELILGCSPDSQFGPVLLFGAGGQMVEVLRDTAAQTMLPALVPPAGLERATGRLWSVELVGTALLGPALGAAVLAAALPLPFALNALGYAVAAVLVARIAGRFRVAAAGPRNWRRELGEGWAVLRDRPFLLALAGITGAWNLLHQMAVIALVLHVQENLGLGAPAYGLILAAGAAGGIAGALSADRIVRQLGPGRTAQAALAVSAAGFAGLALAPTVTGLVVVLMAFEFAAMSWDTVSVSYRQRSVPAQVLGRVNSLYRLFAWGMMPLGLLLSGVIVRAAEAAMPRGMALTMPFAVAALGAAVVAAVAWRAVGRGFGARPA